jgi:Flp pilus assembly protein TadD
MTSRKLLGCALAVCLTSTSMGCTSLSGMWSGKTRPAVTEDSDLNWGMMYENDGDPQLARDAYLAALKKQPNSARAHHRLGVVCDRLGMFDEAVQHYHRAIELAPNNPEIYNDLGYSYYLSGRPQQAERVLRDCLAMNPQNQRAHNNLGMVLGRTGRDAESLEQFRLGGATEDQSAVSLAFVRPRQEIELASGLREEPAGNVQLDGIEPVR